MQEMTKIDEKEAGPAGLCLMSEGVRDRYSFDGGKFQVGIWKDRFFDLDQDRMVYCLVATDRELQTFSDQIFDFSGRVSHARIRVIALADGVGETGGMDGDSNPWKLPPDILAMVLPQSASPATLEHAISGVLELLVVQSEKQDLLVKLGHSYQEIQHLTSVGQSIASERNLDRLIPRILDIARELVFADSGSIYTCDRDRDGKPIRLRFKKSSMNLNANEFTLPINKNSIAGYVAYAGEPLMIDDCYKLSGEEEFRFNNEFDVSHGYYTRSMLVIPMKNHQDDVIGVIQLINRKKNWNRSLTVEEMKGDQVTPFSSRDREIAMALAGQAAMAIENNLLLQDINKLFESFVRASVSAIEQRDPTTSGHSFRVADLCVGMAESVDRLSDGIFSSTKFSPEQIRELRYAALLHDFGKVGVREHVLVKSKKLYDHELEEIRWKYRYLKKHFENQILKRKVNYLKEYGRSGFPAYEASLEEDLFRRNGELTRMIQQIEHANEPTVSEEDVLLQMNEFAKIQVPLENDIVVPFLKENELVSLRVRRGNLNDEERLQIMLHVSNTYTFLIQLPWTRDLSDVPEIALGHHEKLDGSGYPLGMDATEIPVQTRIMTIADIYDALTARDRPYKKELSPEMALEILEKEVQANHLDGNLLKVFIESGVYKKVYEKP